jgi:membrane protease YdiL (CAAX protease family)
MGIDWAITTPREATLGRAFIVAVWAALTTLMIVPFGALPWLMLGLVALTIGAAIARARAALHLAVFATCIVGGMQLPFGVWPLPAAAGLAAYVVLALAVPALRPGLAWARLGRLDRGVLALVAGSVVLAAAGLVSWFVIAEPDIGDLLKGLPRVPAWQLALIAIGFSLVNAAVEEAIYRGALLQGLDAALGAGWIAVVLQALAFGAVHLHGFPRGASGIALATVYGLMMGALRRRSGGMLAPWLGHVAVDVTIIGILAAAA